MNNILSLFNIPESSLVLTGEYEPFLVLVSISIAVFASFMGFQVATQASSAGTPVAKRLLLMVGAIAQGVGIWSMHFVGMLAFELCTSVSYDWHITLISMLPGIGAAWVALRFLTTNTVAPLQIALGGVLVGAGIGAMHYIGMAAMEMAPLLIRLSDFCAVDSGSGITCHVVVVGSQWAAQNHSNAFVQYECQYTGRNRNGVCHLRNALHWHGRCAIC